MDSDKNYVFLQTANLILNGQVISSRRIRTNISCILRIHKEPTNKLQGIQHIGNHGLHKHP